MKAYRIKDWDLHYENNRTRVMSEMRWVPVPNKHDGDGYTCLVEGDDGAALLGCWLAVTQVASKCQPRGTLLRDGDKPHTAASISRITRLPEHLIQKCLEKASSSEVGWLEVIDIEDIARERQEGDTKMSGACLKTTIERNGIERKRREEKAWTDCTSKARIALAYLGQKSGGRFVESQECLGPIAERIKEVAKDYSSLPDPISACLEDCKKMIDRCVKLWKGDPVMEKCLTPGHLFGPKFHGYFGQRGMAIPTEEKNKNPLERPFVPGRDSL